MISEEIEPLAQRMIGLAWKKIVDAEGDPLFPGQQYDAYVSLWWIVKSFDRLSIVARGLPNTDEADMIYFSIASSNRRGMVRYLIERKFGVDPEKAGGEWS